MTNKIFQGVSRSLAKSAQWLRLSATVLFAAAVTVLLMLGVRDANELQAASSALKLAAQLSERPDLISAQLTLIQRGLETTTYIGGSLRTLTALRAETPDALMKLRTSLQETGLLRDSEIAAALNTTITRWQGLDRGLATLSDPRGATLYVDTPSGSELSAQGRAMKTAVDSMLATETQDLQQMAKDMSRLGIALQEAVDDIGLRLRTLLMGGSALAGLMLALVLYYAWRSRLARRAAAGAQQQVANILSTVREGLFLVDRQMRLSPTFSDSLRDLLHLQSPAGLSMEELLEPLTDAKTVAATLKYLGLLWRDKVHEELIESVNPLSEIEISFSNSRGAPEVRYLAFSFRRVRSEESAADYILGVVADVTDRVLLARELENVKADGDSQATMQLQLLRVEPDILLGFLGSADVALRKSNAVLTAPGIEQEDLKKKLNAVFRELHTIKGEAAALTLGSFVERIHALEEALNTLRQRNQLSGNDFLPVVVRLDELISHLSQIREMQERIATLRSLNRQPAPEEFDPASHQNTTVLGESPLERPLERETGVATPGDRSQLLVDILRALTLEEARAQGRAVKLIARGMQEIPPAYAPAVKDICIHMIRNAVAHGIELPAERRQLGKLEEGTVQITFSADAPGDYGLLIEDDGRGLNYEQIVDRALRLELLTPQQAVELDRANIYRLIFQPGFSTVEEVSEHAGRGVGLDAVTNRVRECNGRIGVSTIAGKYTRFRVLLPRVAAAPMSTTSAA